MELRRYMEILWRWKWLLTICTVLAALAALAASSLTSPVYEASTTLLIDQAPMPQVAFVLVMVSAMLTKAGLITAYFMHMRYEHRFLQGMLVVGLLITGAFLFFLILPDAVRISEMMHG